MPTILILLPLTIFVAFIAYHLPTLVQTLIQIRDSLEQILDEESHASRLTDDEIYQDRK